MALEFAGISVQEMADEMGVGRDTIGRWTHDKSPVRRSTLLVWAMRTGVSLAWLEGGQDGLRACRDSNPKPSVLESLRLVWSAA